VTLYQILLHQNVPSVKVLTLCWHQSDNVWIRINRTEKQYCI